MENLSRQIMRNQVIYYIAAAVACLQGILCIWQIIDGGKIINYAADSLQYSYGMDTSGVTLLWGIASLLTGLVALVGFLFAGISGLLRKRVLLGIALGVIGLSYLFAMGRECFALYLYRAFGFLFLNTIGLALFVFLTMAVLLDVRSLRRFITEKLFVAMLIPIGLYLLTIIIAAAGSGLSAGTVLFNLAENLAQVGLIIVSAVLIAEWEPAGWRPEPEPQRTAQNFAQPQGMQQGVPQGDQAFNTATSIQAPDGYRSIALVVIFGIISCGIYLWYWVYKMSEKVNGELGTGKSPLAQMLLFMLVPFYSWYWYYNTTENLNIYASRKGCRVDSSMPVISLVVAIFGLGIVAVALMQDIMNKAVGEFEGATYRQPAPGPAPGQSGPQNVRPQQSPNYEEVSRPQPAPHHHEVKQEQPAPAPSPAEASSASQGGVRTAVGEGYFYVQPETPAPQQQAPAAQPQEPVAQQEEIRQAVVEPVETELAVVEPEETELAVVEPAETELVAVEPKETELVAVEQAETEPVAEEAVTEAAEPSEGEAAEVEAEPDAEPPAEDMAPDDLYAELRKLKALLDEGIIDQGEFETLKKKLIG